MPNGGLQQGSEFGAPCNGDSMDQVFMRRAISLALTAERRRGFGPIGCVIVVNGEIVGEGINETEARHDPTAHAEITAIRRAAAQLQTNELRGATLYSTLQPCGMCSMASIWSRIGRIVFGAQRYQVHSMYFEGRHLDTMDFINDAFRTDLRITRGVLSEQCAALYYRPGDDVPEAEQTNV